MKKGQETRERLMDIAQESILMKGFSATSIDEIIAEAEITKSGFFYHFPDKKALAKSLLERYIESENALLDNLYDRARELHDDPLHAFLIGLKFFAEIMDDLPNGHPGCLVATYCYNDRLFDAEIRDLNRTACLGWRTRFRTILDEIAACYPPKENVDLDDLADMISVVVEGAIVLSKAVRDPKIPAKQIMLLRSWVRMLFVPSLN